MAFTEGREIVNGRKGDGVPARSRIRTRPRTKREVIVDAATEAFLVAGYGAVSMDQIAKAAGVSKQTVYSHFGSKAALFGAVIQARCDRLIQPNAQGLTAEDPERALLELAERFMGAVLAPENMASFRAVIAETGRFPELADAFYRSGPRLAAAYLADYLRAVGKSGEYKFVDPHASARLFFAMMRGDIYMRRLLDVGPDVSKGEVRRAIRHAVRVFLAGHRAA